MKNKLKLLLTSTAVLVSVFSTANAASKTMTLSEVATHNSQSDCFQVINNKVYDLTNYMSQHPGGAEEIIAYCGKEATAAYDSIRRGRGHSSNADSLLADLYVADLGSSNTVSPDSGNTSSNGAAVTNVVSTTSSVDNGSSSGGSPSLSTTSSSTANSVSQNSTTSTQGNSTQTTGAQPPFQRGSDNVFDRYPLLIPFFAIWVVGVALYLGLKKRVPKYVNKLVLMRITSLCLLITFIIVGLGGVYMIFYGAGLQIFGVRLMVYHVYSGFVMVLAALVHLGIHYREIINYIKKIFRIG